LPQPRNAKNSCGICAKTDRRTIGNASCPDVALFVIKQNIVREFVIISKKNLKKILI
jgi:hypothetical protein